MQLARLTLIGGFALAAAAASGCGGDDESDGAANNASQPANGTYIADVPESSAQIGILVDGDKASAYVCDEKGGDAAFLTGSLRDGRLTLKSKDGSASLTGSAGAEGIDGDLTLDGSDRPIEAEPGRGEAGVYYATGREDGKAVLAAWVQDDDGEQTGAKFIDLTSEFSHGFTSSSIELAGPPPPLDPSTGSVLIGDKNRKTSKAQGPGFVEQDN